MSSNRFEVLKVRVIQKGERSSKEMVKDKREILREKKAKKGMEKKEKVLRKVTVKIGLKQEEEEEEVMTEALLNSILNYIGPIVDTVEMEIFFKEHKERTSIDVIRGQK